MYYRYIPMSYDWRSNSRMLRKCKQRPNLLQTEKITKHEMNGTAKKFTIGFMHSTKACALRMHINSIWEYIYILGIKHFKRTKHSEKILRVLKYFRLHMHSAAIYVVNVIRSENKCMPIEIDFSIVCRWTADWPFVCNSFFLHVASATNDFNSIENQLKWLMYL